jgi:hypothetical protein
MASSTTKPVAMVSAISDKLFRLKPNRYIAPSVPTSDSGTDRLGISVARVERRNTKMTSTTRITASDSSYSTSRTEARIVTVRSVRMFRSIAAGSVACNCGSRSLMPCTTEITLAPGWRWILRMIAGVSFIQAPSLSFCAPSTTLPTSLRRTGEPFL